MSQEQRLREITNPHQNDVLSGRGNNVNLHPGNKKYRTIVMKLKHEYIAAPKAKKPQFARMVVETIRNFDPPGRFLKQNAITQLWSDIGDKKAIDKARQALREGAPEIIQQSGVTETASADGEFTFGTTLSSVDNVNIGNAPQTQRDRAIQKGKISPIQETVGDEHASTMSEIGVDREKIRSPSLRDSLESFPGHEGQASNVPLTDSFNGPIASSFSEIKPSSKEAMRNSLYVDVPFNKESVRRGHQRSSVPSDNTAHSLKEALRNSLYADELFEKECVRRGRQRSSILSDNTARLLQKIYGPDLVNLPLGRRDSAIIREMYQASLSDATTLSISLRTNSIGKDFQHSRTDLMHETDFDVSMESVSSNAIHQFVEQLVKNEREKTRDNLESPSWLTDDDFNDSNISSIMQDMASLNADDSESRNMMP